MRKQILKKFNKSIFITKEALRAISNDKEDTITKNIYRWVKNGDLVRLKNGLYISQEVFNLYSSKDSFKCLIANKLRSPSYVSLQYVLAKHNILTEATHPITSVTLKTSRNYENNSGVYIYKSIKRSLFSGYFIENFNSNSYYIATKEKALFDYFYFKKDTLPTNLNDLNLVKELRLNLDTFTKSELIALKKFAKLSEDRKIVKIINNVTKNAYSDV